MRSRCRAAAAAALPQGRGRQPPGESVALILVEGERRAYLDHRPGAPGPSPVRGHVAADGEPVGRRGSAVLAADPPRKVLVLEANQLRDQDQVAVAIAAAPVAAGKARRDRPALALEDQERSRVRPGPGIARLVGPCSGICAASRSARARSNAATIFAWSSGGINSGGTAIARLGSVLI